MVEFSRDKLKEDLHKALSHDKYHRYDQYTKDILQSIKSILNEYEDNEKFYLDDETLDCLYRYKDFNKILDENVGK